MHIFNWMTSWSFSNLKRKSRFQCKIKSFSFVGRLTGKGYFCHLNRWVDSYPSHLPALGIIITILFEIQTGNSIPASNQTSGNTSAHESQTTGRLGQCFRVKRFQNFNFIVLRFSCYYFIYVVSLLCFSFTAIKLSRKSCGSRFSLFNCLTTGNLGSRFVSHTGFITWVISIYTLRDLGNSSNLIGQLSRTSEAAQRRRVTCRIRCSYYTDRVAYGFGTKSHPVWSA